MTQSLQGLLDAGMQCLVSGRVEEAGKLAEQLLEKYRGNPQAQ